MTSSSAHAQMRIVHRIGLGDWKLKIVLTCLDLTKGSF